MKLTFWTLLAFLAVGCLAFPHRVQFGPGDEASDTNLTRRWNDPPPQPAPYILYNNCLCKGTNFFNAFFQTDEQAGQMFQPPRARASRTYEIEQLVQWGFKVNYYVTPAQRNLGGIGTGTSAYGIARALDFIGISSKDRQDGGRLSIVEVYHWDDDQMRLDPPIYPNEQTYRGPDNVIRRYTCMASTFGYSTWPQDGVIINLNIKGVDYAGQERTPPVPHDQLPEMRSLSDLQWALWKNVALPQQINVLRWYFIASIINQDTRQVIQRVLLDELYADRRVLKPWPGLWIPITRNGARAILGTPLGKSLGYFLVQHKPDMGNMWVQGVIIFHGDTAHTSACLAFAIGQPAPRPSLPGEPDNAGQGLVDLPRPELPEGFNVSEMLRKREEAQGNDEEDWIFDEEGERVA